MKRIILIALSSLIMVTLNAQENGGLGQKWGDYEIRKGEDKWSRNSPVTAIWNKVTNVWVSSPKVDKENGELFFLPETEVQFIQGEEYLPQAQGLVEVFYAFRYGKGIKNPTRNALCVGHCGIYRIVNDKMEPIVEAGELLEQAKKWEDRYACFMVIPHNALILGSFLRENNKYSIFNFDGKRLYNDLLGYKIVDGKVSIQLEDGSWHSLNPEDGSIVE